MEDIEKFYDTINKNIKNYKPEFPKMPKGVMGFVTIQPIERNVKLDARFNEVISTTAKQMNKSFDETLNELLNIQLERVQQFQALKDLAKK